MEDSKIYKIDELPHLDFSYQDLRQAENWAKYLATLGWKSVRTPSNINVEIINTNFMSVAKVQRPCPLSQEQLLEIDRVCLENKVAFVKLEPHIQQDLGLLREMGYTASGFPLIPPSTMYLDLTPTADAMWKNLRQSAKYSINRARREGARVETVRNPNPDAVKKFHALSKSTGVK